MRLDSSRVAIITGASSGFGLAVAERFVARGVRLVLGDVSVAAGEAAAQQLRDRYATAQVHFQRCDVTQPDDFRALFDLAVQQFGTVHILMNNAGVPEHKLFPADPTGCRRVIDVNLTAVVTGVELAHEYFCRLNGQEGGVIVNTSSLSGLYPFPEAPVYAATKAGVVNLTRSLKHWRKLYNIRVNAVAPSFAKTPMVTAGKAPNHPLHHIYNTVEIMPVDWVVDAMEQLVTDDNLAGDIARVTPEHRVDIVRSGRAAAKSKHSEQVMAKSKL